jgi:WD40 repeat protein
MTGCWNGTVRVWYSKTGQPLTEPLETEGLIWRSVAFDPTGQCIATRGIDSALRVWPIPSSPTPVPEWFLTLTETVAGIRLGARGQTELIPALEFDAAVQELKSRSKDDYYVRLARWFLADPTNREAAPF